MRYISRAYMFMKDAFVCELLYIHMRTKVYDLFRVIFDVDIY
jgi:hypothetical protein